MIAAFNDLKKPIVKNLACFLISCWDFVIQFLTKPTVVPILLREAAVHTRMVHIEKGNSEEKKALCFKLIH